MAADSKDKSSARSRPTREQAKKKSGWKKVGTVLAGVLALGGGVIITVIRGRSDKS